MADATRRSLAVCLASNGSTFNTLNQCATCYHKYNAEQHVWLCKWDFLEHVNKQAGTTNSNMSRQTVGTSDLGWVVKILVCCLLLRRGKSTFHSFVQ